MKKLLYLIFLLAHGASAFHIVGGEIEFITIRPGTYRINVIQYFDEAQIMNPGPEGQITVYIYRNSDNALMSTHDLLLGTPQEDVPYSNEECAIAQLQTSRVFWTDEIQLTPSEYNDPEGYYIVWERCCRNEAVINIINATGSGMTYVTDIPPLWRNGQPFINSSPALFRPLGDYACQDQLYYIEFTGTDADGDSLVYKLAEPLNSSALLAVPLPTPKPYGRLLFDEQNGYASDNMIPGNPGLAISNRGLLTVNPSKTGLHVFSVVVEEYRAGVKIGQVQRDFQMLVLPSGACNPPDPPEVAVQIPGFDFFQSEVDTLKYQQNDNKCFLFIAKNVSFGETVSFRAEGVNFSGDLADGFSISEYPVAEFSDSLSVEFCAPECPPLQGEPFIVDLIAADDACPLPQLDTVRLVIEVEPLPNALPTGDIEGEVVVLPEGREYQQAFSFTDEDMDSIRIDLIVPGHPDPSLFGFKVDTILSEPGRFEGVFKWDTDCERNLFSEQQRFTVEVRAEDLDYCAYENPLLATFDMNVILPGNNPPVVSILDVPENELVIESNQTISFDVSVNDPDRNEVTLEMFGEGFNPSAFGVSFESSTAIGQTSSTFTWYADCNFLIPGDDNRFTFLFVGRDMDLCKTVMTDTIRYTIDLELPPNTRPNILPKSIYNLEVNEPFELDIRALDDDPEDQLTLSFYNGVRLPASPSIEFETVTGQSFVEGVFRWTPECSLLRNGERTRYDVVFEVRDDFCPLAATDTLLVTFFLEETRANFNNFKPPNAFSPNSDQVNDFFTLSGYTDNSLNLPVDNCDDFFQYISIHDRTGATVFYSEERDFIWDGGNQPAGVYFYSVKYALTEYKNYLQLIK